MATLKEIMGNLKRGDGRIYANKGWDERHAFEPIYWAEGYWYGLDREGSSVEYDECLNKNFYEVKKTKIIKMYSPIIAGYEKNYCSQGEWHTDKTNWAKKPEIKGWLEMEAEVEE